MVSPILNRVFLLFCLSLAAKGAYAQYWYGPRVGGSLNTFVYEDMEFSEEDSVSVNPSLGWELGGMVVYEASKKYAVVSELFYYNVKRTLSTHPDKLSYMSSTSTNHFLAVPLLFRMSFGAEPFHAYVNGGTRISYWLTGKGTINLMELEEFGGSPAEYDRLVFRQNNSRREEGVYAVPDANRVQFALSAGAGFYLDLRTKGKLLMDFRYTFGHSNMGFNNNDDFRFATYREDFRYRANTMTVSLSYLFEYNIKEQRHGMSTIDESNDAKKKKKKKIF